MGAVLEGCRHVSKREEKKERARASPSAGGQAPGTCKYSLVAGTLPFWDGDLHQIAPGPSDRSQCTQEVVPGLLSAAENPLTPFNTRCLCGFTSITPYHSTSRSM